MNFESLIFDIDGTLWDSRALVAIGYNIQLEREGLGHLATNADVLKTLFGKTMTDIADVLFDEIPAPERYDLMERCMATRISISGKIPATSITPASRPPWRNWPRSIVSSSSAIPTAAIRSCA